MGRFLNPDNSAFCAALNSEIKTSKRPYYEGRFVVDKIRLFLLYICA